jgi:hypothetical protein
MTDRGVYTLLLGDKPIWTISVRFAVLNTMSKKSTSIGEKIGEFVGRA